MTDTEIVMVLTVIVIAICVACFREDQSHFSVPKTIWTYVSPLTRSLHGEELLQRCVDSWKTHHPDFRIVVMTDDDYRGYVTHLPGELNYTQRGAHHHPVFHDEFSSLLRLYVLAEYGGVWLDPTVELKKPLTQWLFSVPTTFAGVCRGDVAPPQPPDLDTWLLAAVPNHDWVIRWRDEYTRAAEFASMDKYVESRRMTTRQGSNLPSVMVAAQALLQQEKSPELWTKKMELWREDDPVVRKAVIRH